MHLTAYSSMQVCILLYAASSPWAGGASRLVVPSSDVALLYVFALVGSPDPVLACPSVPLGCVCVGL